MPTQKSDLANWRNVRPEMVLREPKLHKSCSYFVAQFYNPPIMVRAAFSRQNKVIIFNVQLTDQIPPRIHTSLLHVQCLDVSFAKNNIACPNWCRAAQIWIAITPALFSGILLIYAYLCIYLTYAYLLNLCMYVSYLYYIILIRIASNLPHKLFI